MKRLYKHGEFEFVVEYNSDGYLKVCLGNFMAFVTPNRERTRVEKPYVSGPFVFDGLSNCMVESFPYREYAILEEAIDRICENLVEVQEQDLGWAGIEVSKRAMRQFVYSNLMTADHRDD